MFRTEINIRPSRNKLHLSSPVMAIGSCFSDCMGYRLQNYKFETLANPFGTVYNPISIFKLLENSVEKRYPDEDTYLYHQGLHANYNFHSSFAQPEINKVKQSIEKSIDNSALFLKKCRWLIITLGTSFVYRRNDNQEIVANCHKLPGHFFKKEMLSIENILTAFTFLNQKIINYNPGINIIFTVSPVRHVKDTIDQNSLSKALLRVVCDKLVKQYQNIQYFPSYEIMLDDLRDYRFYKSDMIHPNEVAEKYIWDKFTGTFFDKETQDFLPQWDKFLKAVQHRPFNPGSVEHQKFINETIGRLKKLEKKVDITPELQLLQKQLIQ